MDMNIENLFGFFNKHSKRNWGSASLSSEVYWTGVNLIIYGKLSGIP